MEKTCSTQSCGASGAEAQSCERPSFRHGEKSALLLEGCMGCSFLAFPLDICSFEMLITGILQQQDEQEPADWRHSPGCNSNAPHKGKRLFSSTFQRRMHVFLAKPQVAGRTHSPDSPNDPYGNETCLSQDAILPLHGPTWTSSCASLS